MRTAVVEANTGLVVTVIERGVQPPHPRVAEATEPPEGFAWVEHETAGVGWMLFDGALVKPEEPKPEPTAQQKIEQLERTEGQGVYVRGVREYMLGSAQMFNAANAIIQDLTAKIREIGGSAFAGFQPPALPDISQAAGMKNVKALDDKIKVLRSQI